MSAVVSSILARHDPIYWSIPYILPLFQKYVTVSGEVKPYVQEHQLWMVVQDHLRHKHCAISTNNVLEEGFSDRPPPIVQILYCTGNIAATDHWPAPPPLHVQSLVLCKNKLCANFVQEAMPLRTWIAALLLHQHLCKYFQTLFKFCAGHASSQQETWALKLLICFCWSFTTLFSSVSVSSDSRLSL